MRLLAALPPLILYALLPTIGLVVSCLLPVCQRIERHRPLLRVCLQGNAGRGCIGKCSSLSRRRDGAGGRVAVLPAATCLLHQSVLHGSLRVLCVGHHLRVDIYCAGADPLKAPLTPSARRRAHLNRSPRVAGGGWFASHTPCLGRLMQS